MKKKLSWLCIVVVVVLCISFLVWRNRVVRVADIIGSMKLKKKLRSESDGFVFSIVIYQKNSNKNQLTLSQDIIIDGKYYECDRDYCDDMLKLYDSFQK